jgi:hypothetical protein
MLFFWQPWYAHAIAEAIMRTANFSVPLKVSVLQILHVIFVSPLRSSLFHPSKFLRQMLILGDCCTC